MEFTAEVDVGRVRVMEKRSKSDYMLRSEKRTGGYHSRPPKRGNPFGRFLYAILTLIVLVVLWPVGLVMLWGPKLRWTGVTKLLTSIVTAIVFFLFLAYLLTMPIEDPQLYAFQQRARRGFVAIQEDASQWVSDGAEAIGEKMGQWNEGFQGALENMSPIARTLYGEGMYHVTGWLRDGAETVSRWIDPAQQTVWADGKIYHTRRDCEENQGEAMTLGEAQEAELALCEECAKPAPTPQPTPEPTPTATPEITPEPTVSPTVEPEPTPEATFRVVNSTQGGIEPAGAAATPVPTPTYAPETPAPTQTPEPTSEATPTATATPKVTVKPVPTVQPTPDMSLLPELMDVADAHVWYTGNGKYYHKYSQCGSMESAKRHTLAEAFAAGRETCPWCHPISEADMAIEEPVWMTDGTKVYHISDDCGQLGDSWTFMTLEDAKTAKGNPCEECGAYHYVNQIPLPEKVQAKATQEALRAAAATPVPTAARMDGDAIVYFGDKSKYYHANSGCRTITSAAPHTLQEAVDAGKENCPYCAAPILAE